MKNIKKNKIETQILDSIPLKYDKKLVEQELLKYRKFTSLINQKTFQLIEAIFILLLLFMYLLSFEETILFYDLNILEVFPSIISICYVSDRFLSNIQIYLRNNIIFFIILLFLGLIAVFTLNKSIIVFTGIVCSISQLITKRNKLKNL